MLDPHLIATFLVMLGWALLGVIALQLAWCIARLLLLPAVNGQAVREVARVLAATLRAQRSPDLALLSLQAQLRWPMPWRLRAAARLLADRNPVSVVTALALARVLPAALIPGGHAAEAMGPAALIRWFDGLAGPAPHGPLWWRTLIPAIGLLATGTVLVVFITNVILPKYVDIFLELGVPTPAAVRTMAGFSLHLPSIWITLGLLVVIIWWPLHSWRWRRQAWYDRGLLLATAGDHRFPEGRLAEVLGRSPAAIAAGAAGDLPGLAAEVGWSCRDLPDLRRRYGDALRRRERRRQIAATAIPVLVTLVLALPAWWYCTTLFGMLTGIIRTLAELA